MNNELTSKAVMDKALEYADKRRAETGQGYIVSDYGRVLLDCPGNRRVLRELGEDIVYRS